MKKHSPLVSRMRHGTVSYTEGLNAHLVSETSAYMMRFVSGEHHNPDLNYIGKFALSELPRELGFKVVLTGEGMVEKGQMSCA